MARFFLFIGGLMGFLAVIAGSWSAHGLEKFLTDRFPDDVDLRKLLANFRTAAEYQMYHALALLAVAWVCSHRSRLGAVAGFCFVIGIIGFSGSLYTYSITGDGWWGRVTPFGGAALLIGWALLAFAAPRTSKRDRVA